MFNSTTRRFQAALLSAAFVAAASLAGPPDTDAPVDPVPVTPVTPITPVPPALSGDFNGDCIVDMGDIDWLLKNDRFGTDYAFADVLEVLGSWGATCH